MQKTKLTHKLSLILCMVSIAAMTLFATACSSNTNNTADTAVESTEEEATAETTDDAEAEEDADAAETETEVLGEGETEFYFTVTDADGVETAFTIHTDKATVGEALLDVDLIAGDESEYGLYVKTVNGVTVDYDTDGKYWAFYVDGEYASTGVDATEITEGSTYEFKVE